MIEYKVYWTFTLRLQLIAIPVWVVAFGIFLAVLTTIGAIGLDAPSLFLAALFPPAVALFVAMQYWRLPTRIHLFEDGRVRFESWIRKTEVRVGDIRAIKPGSWSPGFLEVTTRGGKIRILSQYDGFHEFLARVKRLNPTVEIRGC